MEGVRLDALTLVCLMGTNFQIQGSCIVQQGAMHRTVREELAFMRRGTATVPPVFAVGVSPF